MLDCLVCEMGWREMIFGVLGLVQVQEKSWICLGFYALPRGT